MRKERYALVGMPWFWAYLPSIQLAILADLLGREEVESEVFEFYADLVESTGMHLYKAIANASGYTGELIYSQFYYDGFAQQHRDERPFLGLATPELERATFDFLTPIVEDRLEAWCAELDRGEFDAVCFSLTASQTAASMAMAKRIRRIRPDLPIVFGGSSCAGEMGRAIARLCPEVDIVAHDEAEAIVPRLVKALRGETPLADVPGISWRDGDRVRTNARAPLHRLGQSRGPLNFDSYHKRAAGNSVLSEHGVWTPFESSRGCWYGQKAQCTFCGLNEIIRYRERGAEGLLAELEDYERRYGAKRFFAVDLIMPRAFFSDFLPAVAAADKDWTIFYEIKSNLSRPEIERLAAANVKWIQPGIESLDDSLLKLMRKGVTAAQNIQTLKWARELGITASWNLITGFPRERAGAYSGMAELFPRLHHLLPPVGLGDFEVHRFSPYFEKPAEHGIELLGAYPTYSEVYPVGSGDLDDLVYRYAYRLLDPPDPGLPEARARLARAVARWREASARGAAFSCERLAGGRVRLADTREGPEPVTVVLSGPQSSLYLFLDEMRPAARLADLFQARDPAAFRALGGERGIARLIDDWDSGRLVCRVSGYVLGLAVQVRAAGRESEGRRKGDARNDSSNGHAQSDQGIAV